MSAEETRIPGVCYAGIADGQKLECDAGTEVVLVRVLHGATLAEVHSYRFANRTDRAGRWVFTWERCVGAQGNPEGAQAGGGAQ
jgi:hypothetical protein